MHCVGMSRRMSRWEDSFVVYAMRFGLTVKMLAEAILPYPTLAEAVRWAAAQF